MTQPEAAVPRRVRCTEYMKKFREPKWETFSKCYEDSLRYRLTRRLMEHSHKPWAWSGWDRVSDSSGGSTPRLSRSKTAPLSLPPPGRSQVRGPGRLSRFEPPPEPKAAFRSTDPEANERDTDTSLAGSGPSAARPGPPAEAPGSSGPSETTETDAGPLESSDEEPARPGPRRRPRRAPGPPHHGGSGEESGAARKPPRAKSQPSLVAKETLQNSGRHHWLEVKQQNRVTADASVQTTRRSSDKRASNPDRRRARSADLEQSRRPGLTVADSHWVTEYMRCFSARLR